MTHFDVRQGGSMLQITRQIRETCISGQGQTAYGILRLTVVNLAGCDGPLHGLSPKRIGVRHIGVNGPVGGVAVIGQIVTYLRHGYDVVAADDEEVAGFRQPAAF